MLEEPTWEQAMFMANMSGGSLPRGVTLRGDGTRISLHPFEVALVQIHRRTKQFYDQNIHPYYQRTKHLYSQQRTLDYYCASFKVAPYKLFQPMAMFDFIARPFPQVAAFEDGLADLIFISEKDRIPFILEFHHFNYVEVENGDPVYFLKIIENYLTIFLKNRPGDTSDKLSIIYNWVLDKASRLSPDKRFDYWKYHQYEPGRITNPTGRLAVNCSFELARMYFDILKLDNPRNGKPFLNNEAVDWIISKYLRPSYAKVEQRPDFELNITQGEIKYFVFQFHQFISNTQGKATTLTDLFKMCNDVFPKLFPKNPRNYTSNVHKALDNVKLTVREVLDFNNHQDIRDQIERERR